MRGKKYLLNVKTHTLHIINGCCHSKHISNENKTYATEDEAIAENQSYMRKCRICFRNK